MAAEDLAQQVFAQLGGCGGPKATARYVAVPGNAEVRWLLPADGKALEGVLASWTPYRRSSRMAWAVVRAASRMGGVAELPGAEVVEVERTQGIDWQSLGWRWNGEPIPVIYIGTPGPKRKAVVHLVERATARCRAVVKVPLTLQAEAALRHEAAVLAALQKRGCEAAPRLLRVDPFRGAVTQKFVEGRPGSRKLDAEHWKLLRSLMLPGETTSLEKQAKRWELQVAGLRLPERVRVAFDELADDEPVPACWQHGDFTPWNIRRTADGRLALLDWEEAERGCLPLFDAFHFLHMQDFLFGKRPELHAREVYEAAREMGISTRLTAKLEMAYLVHGYVTCVLRKNDERARFISCALARFRSRAA
jgi:Phosphotransferase enzyme family